MLSPLAFVTCLHVGLKRLYSPYNPPFLKDVRPWTSQVASTSRGDGGTCDGLDAPVLLDSMGRVLTEAALHIELEIWYFYLGYGRIWVVESG